MTDNRHYFAVYFDSAEQKKAFRAAAARRDLSMAELAKRTLVEAHDLPVFFDAVSDFTDEHAAKHTPAA